MTEFSNASANPDWDPEPGQRELVRDVRTGDLGWFVRRGGKKCVKLDRPGQDIVRVYREAEWKAEESNAPLARITAGRVAFEADRALCSALGLHAHAKRSWQTLGDAERQLFGTRGPKQPSARVELHKAVMAALEPFVRD